MIAFAERWVGTINRECLDHFVAAGLRHLDYLVCEFVRHYHESRPHQGLGNQLILRSKPPPHPSRVAGRIVCRQRPGRVLKGHHRSAA